MAMMLFSGFEAGEPGKGLDMTGWPRVPEGPDITRPKRPPGEYHVWMWEPALQEYTCWLVEVR